MIRTAYFRNGRWHITLTDSPQDHDATTTADVTMLEAIRRGVAGGQEARMMENYPHIYTDPFGDRHTIMEKYYCCGVADDHSRSYQDKYYPINRLGGNPYRDEPEILHGRRAY